jgi:chemotaxis response regulator CheB
MRERDSRRGRSARKRALPAKTLSGKAPKVPKAQPRTRAVVPQRAAGDRAPAIVAEDERPASRSAFPIVGIGASAGGLEALDVFLKRVPAKPGMAFVVVQHLDPKNKGMLVELLQRSTSMPVMQAEDGSRVEPDHVYVIRPGRTCPCSTGPCTSCRRSPPGG